MTVATFLCSGQIYCQVCTLYPWSKSMALPETKVMEFLWCLISYLFQSTAADISSIWSCICRDFLLRPQVWWPQEMKSHSIHIIAGLANFFHWLHMLNIEKGEEDDTTRSKTKTSDSINSLIESWIQSVKKIWLTKFVHELLPDDWREELQCIRVEQLALKPLRSWRIFPLQHNMWRARNSSRRCRKCYSLHEIPHS